jgi:hypothetical protein
MTHPYVYIFIRKDLPNPQKIVQSSHAVWELSKIHNLEAHPSVIVIGVNSELQLKNQIKKFRDLGFNVSEFREPLFNNEITAAAILTTTLEERFAFKKFNLLSENSFKLGS